MTSLELLKKKVNYPEPEDWPVPIKKAELRALLDGFKLLGDIIFDEEKWVNEYYEILDKLEGKDDSGQAQRTCLEFGGKDVEEYGLCLEQVKD